MCFFGRLGPSSNYHCVDLFAGNWDRNVRMAHYSSQIPIQGMLVMAGFEKDDQYWLPRCRVVPCDELLCKVWPWLDYTMHFVENDAEPHPTAMETLKYWSHLRVILLQDVAAMLCLLPEDDPVHSHGLFQFPVFKSAAFLAFVEEMRAKLQLEAQPDNDPNLKSVERALPGVNKQFTRTQTLVTECHVAAEEAAFHAVEAAGGVGEMKEKLSQLEEAVKLLPEHTSKHGKKTRDLLRNFASCLKQGFNVFEDVGETDDEGDGLVFAADASPSSPCRRGARVSESPKRPHPPPVEEEEETEEGKGAFFGLCGGFWESANELLLFFGQSRPGIIAAARGAGQGEGRPVLLQEG